MATAHRGLDADTVARFSEQPRDLVDETARRWVKHSLIEDRSLTDPSRHGVWTVDVVRDLDRRFNGNPLVSGEGGGTFSGKWEIQLDGGSPALMLLAAEILLVHFLFVNSVTYRGKLDVLNATVAGTEVTLDPASVPMRAMAQGIGHPGVGFNTRRDLQVGYLIDFCLRLKQLGRDERAALLEKPWALRDFADDTDKPLREMRHIVLHLLHPETFERMSSGAHKREIATAFADLVENPGLDVDEQLFAIRSKLTTLMPRGNAPGQAIDFYHPPLRGVWESAGDSGEGAGDLEALGWKKQIVLYGPPGTSKTYQARELAETIIRRAALRRWGFRSFIERGELVETAVRANISWVQLHPGFGYPEFIRGLRLDGDRTRYHPGLLPIVVDRYRDQELPDGLAALPVVLVLDEINRTDLSAMFGEAFSLLEAGQRGRAVTLPGINPDEPPATLALPEDLYLIGTMNEIDQSVETLDFALRRRFLWRECPFERETLLEIIQARWADAVRGVPYDHAAEQLSRFADHAETLNAAISESAVLGRAYHVGHTYFADIVFFLGTWLSTRKNRPANGAYLWRQPRDQPQPPLFDLWNRSLKPLLEQYLAGIDDRDQQMDRLRRAFLSQ